MNLVGVVSINILMIISLSCEDRIKAAVGDFICTTRRDSFELPPILSEIERED